MDPEINKVIDNIKQLEMLKDMETKAFADEDGYADIVSHRLAKERSIRPKLKTSQLRKFFELSEILNEKMIGKNGNTVLPPETQTG